MSELWTPGQPLDNKYEPLSPEDFQTHFIEAVWPNQPATSSDFVTLEDSLAVLKKPQTRPDGFAFLDIDDVVSSLSLALRHVQYGYEDSIAPRTSLHDYGEGMFFEDADIATKYPLIRLIKNSVYGMQPDPEIALMQRIVSSWRDNNIFVSFITSAIPGTERCAASFVGKHFTENCDGLVITSGHYQLADKGRAAVDIIDFCDPVAGVPAVHIDDLPFNTKKVREALVRHPRQLKVATFQPELPSHFDYDDRSRRSPSIAGTFELASEFLGHALGRGEMVLYPTPGELIAAFSEDTFLG